MEMREPDDRVIWHKEDKDENFYYEQDVIRVVFLTRLYH